MADLFPTDVVVQTGTELPDRFLTLRSSGDSVLKTQGRWAFPKMRGGRLLFLVDSTDLELIRHAWANARGSGTFVDFRYPWPDIWYGLYVATGDGVTETFDIPGYDTSDPVCYVNGVEDAGAIFGSGAGANDRDTVHPSSTPADGDVISVDFTGQRQIVAALGDSMTAIEKGPGSFSVSLQIDEV